MKIIEQSSEILHVTPDALKLIELAGRTCYKSEDRITDKSANVFVDTLTNSYKHESVLEHANITAKFITDRGVTHELVRHRIAAYSQESTRYCNYSKDKHGNELSFIKPVYWNLGSDIFNLWVEQMSSIERMYMKMLSSGASPQEARAVLPNSLKTEIIMTANFREWRHVFKLRTSNKAHPQIRSLMLDFHAKIKSIVPVVFNSIVDEPQYES